MNAKKRPVSIDAVTLQKRRAVALRRRPMDKGAIKAKYRDLAMTLLCLQDLDENLESGKGGLTDGEDSP